MRIESVRVRNFRALHDVTIAFDDVTTFIGPNGAGKSTILNALDWFFNGTRVGLSQLDCNTGHESEDISVSVTFKDLTDLDREALGNYVSSRDLTFTVWKTRQVDGSETLSANASQYAPFSDVRATQEQGAKPYRSAYEALRVSRPDLELPAVSRADQIESAFRTWELEHFEELEEAPKSLSTSLFGFNGAAVMSGLFDYVYVKADYRAAEESVDGKATIVGRILEKTVDRTIADAEIEKIVESSRERQEQVYKDAFGERLEEINRSLTAGVGTLAHGRGIEVTPTQVQLRSPRTTFEVAIIDGETRTAVDRQGHGFQRTLLIAALRMLASSEASGSRGVVCLALEEPELFQHPLQAKAFAKVLRDLGERPSGDVQIIYATHSPHFVEIKHFDQVRRVTRSSGKSSVHASSITKVRERLRDILSADQVSRQLDGMVANTLSMALFAERVVLVEGTTDAAVVLGLADRKAIASLEGRGVEVTAAGSKSSLPLAAAIVESLGIATFVLFDADGGQEARSRRARKDNNTILDEIANNSKQNQALFTYLSVDVPDFPPLTVFSRWACFEDTLEDALEEWSGWADLRDKATRETGAKFSKNAEAYRQLVRRAEGEVPAGLADVAAAIDRFAVGGAISSLESSA